MQCKNTLMWNLKLLYFKSHLISQNGRKDPFSININFNVWNRKMSSCGQIAAEILGWLDMKLFKFGEDFTGNHANI